MDLLLLSVTVASLLVALVMSVAVWRLSRDARARSAARMAALSASAAGESPELPTQSESQERLDRPRSAPEIEWGAVPQPVAVNQSRPAPWAPARVSAFSGESGDRRGSDASDRRNLRHAEAAPTRDLPLAPMGEAFLGSAVAEPSSGGRQRALAIAACVLFLVVLTSGYWTIYGERSSGVGAAAVTSAMSPLELVSLRHERRGSRLAITGLVRNPTSAGHVERLAAIVFLFDQQSRFITSARADIDFTKLLPGDESPFVVAVEAPATVARYRVSFRNDGGVVPHVDRRGQEPIARELP
jgi:hypothetical protein